MAKQMPTTITLTEDHSLLWENMKAASAQTKINLTRLNLEAGNLAARAQELNKQVQAAEQAWAAAHAEWTNRQSRSLKVLSKAYKVDVPHGAITTKGKDGRFTLTWNAPAKAKKKVAKKKTKRKVKKRVAKKTKRKRA